MKVYSWYQVLAKEEYGMIATSCSIYECACCRIAAINIGMSSERLTTATVVVERPSDQSIHNYHVFNSSVNKYMKSCKGMQVKQKGLICAKPDPHNICSPQSLYIPVPQWNQSAQTASLGLGKDLSRSSQIAGNNKATLWTSSTLHKATTSLEVR